MKINLNHLPVVAFCLLGIIWGSNFIYMKLASKLITPSQIVFFRVLFGFIPVIIYSFYLGVLSWKHLKHSGHFLVMALLATTIYYYGFAKGTSLLLSGVAGAVSGAIPIFAFILSVLFIAEEKICDSDRRLPNHIRRHPGSGCKDPPGAYQGSSY